MKRTILCLLFALALIVPLDVSAAPEAPLTVDATGPASELTSGQQFTFTVIMFSTSAVDERLGLTQQLDPARFEVASITKTRGVTRLNARSLDWSADVRRDLPALLSITLKVRADAPAGQVTLPVTATNTEHQTATDRVTLRICCSHAPPAQVPPRLLYLPLITR